jgi:hypothetical protein
MPGECCVCLFSGPRYARGGDARRAQTQDSSSFPIQPAGNAVKMARGPRFLRNSLNHIARAPISVSDRVSAHIDAT